MKKRYSEKSTYKIGRQREEKRRRRWEGFKHWQNSQE